MNKIFGIIALLALIACVDEKKTSTENSAALQKKSEQSTGPVTIPEDELTAKEYTHEVVVPDLQIGWGMTFFPDGSILITEKSGKLIHYQNGNKTEIRGVPEIYNRGQGGFLDVALDPNYQESGWIYFTYSSPEGPGEGGNTALLRAKMEGNSLQEKEQLYKATPNTTKGQHFGSRIAFDEEGHIYFSIGDRGNRDENPQDITRDGGKIYRLNPDGSIPAGNPFVGKENAKEAIFSYGHRNPQGMLFNPETDEIWVHEHGPQGGDEINVVKKGANYGWPVVTYGKNYDGSPITKKTTGPKFEDPIYYWLPSIAPSGFVFVTSDKYPELKGDLLVGSLKFQYLEHLALDGKTVTAREKLLKGLGRVRDVVQAPDGYIYVSIEGKGIVKLIPNKEDPRQTKPTELAPESKTSISKGATVYNNFCASCHLSNGEGIEGVFPPLAGSSWLTEKRKETIRAVKFGLSGPIEVNDVSYDNLMPDPGLTDQETANVLNYIFQSWGNQVAPPVTEEEVAAIEK